MRFVGRSRGNTHRIIHPATWQPVLSGTVKVVTEDVGGLGQFMDLPLVPDPPSHEPSVREPQKPPFSMVLGD